MKTFLLACIFVDCVVFNRLSILNFIISFVFVVERYVNVNVISNNNKWIFPMFWIFISFQFSAKFVIINFLYCITQQVHFFFFLSSTITWLADCGPGTTAFEIWVFCAPFWSTSLPPLLFGLCWFCDACKRKNYIKIYECNRNSFENQYLLLILSLFRPHRHFPLYVHSLNYQ